MAEMTLTPQQQQAVDWLVAQLCAGAPLVALRGLAGTGKTSVIPALQQALAAHNLMTTLGAPTHRAVMILRKKGLDADTVHSQALQAFFTVDYRRACHWLGELLPARIGDDAEAHPDVEGLPWLVYEAVKPDLARGRALLRQRRYKARRRLASLGISGKDYFAGWAPKEGRGVLIIDEGSMVGQKMLALCQEAYPQIVLVGDPGQLPPVKDAPVLMEAPGVELTEIHRQAQDSPILTLAFAARQGQPFWHSLPTDALSTGAPVRILDEVSASRFLTCPLLVWRNVTRVTSTQAIRAALGYPSDAVVTGEPLVCRATSQDDRALGFFNNALYTIKATMPDDPRLVVVEDALGDSQLIRLHVEELDGDMIDPRAIPFRFGYCLTVHTAQGGEWPRVYISLTDLRAYAGFARQQQCSEDLARWAYTAITRAKDTLRFLSTHSFTTPEKRTLRMAKAQTIAPPSAPMLTRAPTTDLPGLDDDIPDVAVPQSLQDALQSTQDDPPTLQPQEAAKEPLGDSEGLERHNVAMPHETLLPLMQGFCDVLQKKVDVATEEHYRDMTRELTKAWETTERGLMGLRDKNDHVLYQLAHMFAQMQEHGLPVRYEPYSADVRAYSPNGYPLVIHMTQPTQGDLLAELKTLTDWLAEKGCKPGN